MRKKKKAGTRPWSGDQPVYTQMVTSERDDGGDSGFLRSVWRLFVRLSWIAAAALAVYLIVLAGRVVKEGAASVYRGQARMEIACDICGRTIREGYRYEITPFSNYTLLERATKKASGVVSAMTAPKQDADTNTNTNTNTDTDVKENQGILDTPGSHYDLCPDCRERVRNLILGEKARN